MVRVGEIEAHACLLFDAFVVMELGAVVGGDGLEAPSMFANQPHSAFGQFGLAAVSQFADQGVAGLAFDQGHDAILAAGAHHGVDFPVCGFAAILDARRPFADVPLAGEAAAAVVATIALAPLLAGAAQVLVQPSATPFVAPDVLVDGLVTDRKHVVAPQVAGNLLGAPQVWEQALDQAERVGPEAPIAPRSPAAGVASGFTRPVGAIVATVAAKLARDAAGVSAQLARNPRGAVPLRSQGGEHIPLSRGDLAIRHVDDSLLAGKGSSPVSQIASFGFQAGRCALTC